MTKKDINKRTKKYTERMTGTLLNFQTTVNCLELAVSNGSLDSEHINGGFGSPGIKAYF